MCLRLVLLINFSPEIRLRVILHRFAMSFGVPLVVSDDFSNLSLDIRKGSKRNVWNIVLNAVFLKSQALASE